VVRVALVVLFIAAIALTLFLLIWHREKEAWSSLAGALAVIAALIAIIPALRLLELQEDALRPRPIPYFDLTSRYQMHQLRVKNFGGSVAYNIRLEWNAHPVNYEDEKIESLDHITVLLPGESVSTLVGVSTNTVKKYASSRYTGKVRFEDATGKKWKDKFICSVDADQKRLVHDEEMPRTLRDLQDIPKELTRIADALKKLTDTGTRS
jgi:hypothetical protein